MSATLPPPAGAAQRANTQAGARRLLASGLALTLGIAVLAVLAGLAWSAGATTDDLSGWQATPMTPDPALSVAAGSNPSCQARAVSLMATEPPPLALPVQVVLQDRRTPRTAGFVVTTTGYVGVCLLSTAGDGQGYLVEAPLPPMADSLAVEGAGGGVLGARPGSGSYVWGRADGRIASVTIDLVRELHAVDDDDRLVTASLGGGYWFGWWPDNARAAVVTGFDVGGDAVVTLKDFDDGWAVQ